MPSSLSILGHFSALEDPRQHWRVVYPLPEILLPILYATLSGMDDFVEIRLWGEQRLDFLRRLLPYERGLPDHDTLTDVVNALDADLFQDCFSTWLETLREAEPDLIAIAAIGTQTAIAETIVARGGDDLLALEANRLVTHDDVVRFFEDPANRVIETHATLDNDHGRVEQRRYSICHDVAWMRSDRRYPHEPHFPHLTMISMVETRVERAGGVAHERRYDLSSAKLDARTFAAAVRAHWHVENRLHWILDVVFHDDLVRHIAMNLVRAPKDRHSLKVHRKLANLDPDYRETLIRQTQAHPSKS